MNQILIKNAVALILCVFLLSVLFAACNKVKKPEIVAEATVEESSDCESDTGTTDTEITLTESTTTAEVTTTTTTRKTTATSKRITKVSTIENGGLGKNADHADLKLDDSTPETIATVTTRASTATSTTQKTDNRSNTSSATVGTTNAPVENSHYLSVKNIMQNPELPTGCEVTSLTIVLNHLGYNVDKCYLVDNYLPWTTTWDSINTHFIGNPRSVHGCGCNAPVIVNTANRYLNDNGGKYTAVNKTGSSPSHLYDMVKNGYPVMVWATIGMQDTYISGEWTAQDTGEQINFMKREHCLVLTGYDKDAGTVTFCDPMVGIASYSMSTFETRYNQLGNQAVIIK